MKSKLQKIERNPVLMFLASILLLTGLVVVVLGVVNFVAWGWLFALLVIVGGLGSIVLSLMTIVTRKAEWLLLDLILPG